MSEEKNPFNLQLTWTDPRSGEEQKQVFALPMTIGRDSSNNLMIPSTSISRQHAQLEFDGGNVILKDLNSSNGTSLNGQPVTEIVLSDGDEMVLGEIKIGVLFTTDEARTKRPSRDHLFGALLAGEAEPTISLQSIKKTKGLFADVSPDSAGAVEAPRPAEREVTSEKLSGADLKAFLSGRLQKDIQKDISPDVQQMAASYKPKTEDVIAPPKPPAPPEEATVPVKPVEPPKPAEATRPASPPPPVTPQESPTTMGRIFDRLRRFFGN